MVTIGEMGYADDYLMRYNMVMLKKEIYGLLTEIANLFGISRERVRQLSLAEDTIPSRTQTLKRYCLICGKEKQSWQKKYCSMKCAHQGNLLRLPLVNCHNCKRECREYPELQNSLLKKGTTYPPDMATIEHLYDRLEPEKRYQIYPNNEDKVLACLECNHARAKKRLRALGRKEQTRRTLLGQERRVKGIKTPRLYYFKKQ